MRNRAQPLPTTQQRTHPVILVPPNRHTSHFPEPAHPAPGSLQPEQRQALQPDVHAQLLAELALVEAEVHVLDTQHADELARQAAEAKRREDTQTALGKVEFDDKFQCVVCTEVYESATMVLPCTHTFCRHCILQVVATAGEQLLNPLCPLCRRQFDGKKLTPAANLRKVPPPAPSLRHRPPPPLQGAPPPAPSQGPDLSPR
jgi:hypothetical protein